MKKVAIFGGNGYVGVHLATHFIAAGGEIDVYDVQEEPAVVGCGYHRCDVTNPDFWTGFEIGQYDAVYFLAGLSGPESSFGQAELYCDVNEKGLLSLCRKAEPLGGNSPKIVFPSSRLVYHGGERVTEESLLEARSIYAANKIACEGLLSAYHHRFGVPYAALRICVPYGNLVGTTYSYGTIGFFLKCIREGRPVTVYGNGSNRKTYTFIADVCEIMTRVASRDVASGVYNVGGYDYSLCEIADLLVKRFGGEVVFTPWPEAALRVEMGDISLDSSKLDHAIRFEGYRKFEDVVQNSLTLG